MATSDPGSTGSLRIVANGDVEGTNFIGIFARNDTTSVGSVSITTNGKVTGGEFGIRSLNYGSGALSIVANGDVVGTASDGIYAYSGTSPIGITVGAGATISGNTGVRFVDGAANTLNNHGHVRSLSGAALRSRSPVAAAARR